VPYYPTAIPNTTNYPDRSDDVDWIYAERYNEIKNEVIAICAELGINPRGASADVVTRLALLALKTNVLELDNAVEFTPAADYEPATKKYVDDNTISEVKDDTGPELGGALASGGNPINMADAVISRPELKDYSETKTAPSSSSNVLTLDLEAGNVFEVTLTENVTTLTLSNPSPTTKCCSFTLILTQDSTPRTVAWGAAVHFGEGEEPDISTADAVYILTFFTLDAGTKWYGFLAGSEMAVPA